MRVELVSGPFDPQAVLRRQEDRLREWRGRIGAAVSFIGTMRDFNDDAAVTAMFLEHYPGMTERELERIAREAEERFAVVETLIVHRVGEVRPADPIVLAAAWSAHRAPAFDACRYLVEALKTRAPLWKKEIRGDGGRWVRRNTPAV